MQNPAPPDDEAARVAVLRAMLIPDTSPDDNRFDHLTAYTAPRFNVPIALVSLGDADRQWIASKHGIDDNQTPPDISFCRYAYSDNSVLVIPDATVDSRFSDDPLVLDGLKIRFYAGAPIIDKTGKRIGTLSIIDHVPQNLSEREVAHFELLAKIVAGEIASSSERKNFRSWTPEMSVGNVTLDNDHKAFFNIASLLNDLTNLDGKGTEIESCLNVLKEYIEGHFLREEMAMKSAGYPDTEAHIKVHMSFRQSLNTLFDNYHRGIDGTLKAMGILAVEWWINHIQTVDAKYTNYIKDKDVDSRPLGEMIQDANSSTECSDGFDDIFQEGLGV